MNEPNPQTIDPAHSETAPQNKDGTAAPQLIDLYEKLRVDYAAVREHRDFLLGEVKRLQAIDPASKEPGQEVVLVGDRPVFKMVMIDEPTLRPTDDHLRGVISEALRIIRENPMPMISLKDLAERPKIDLDVLSGLDQPAATQFITLGRQAGKTALTTEVWGRMQILKRRENPAFKIELKPHPVFTEDQQTAKMKHHPEQQDDEIYMGNSTFEGVLKSSWLTKRRGNPVSGQNEDIKPWFIKVSGVEARITARRRENNPCRAEYIENLQQMIDERTAFVGADAPKQPNPAVSNHTQKFPFVVQVRSGKGDRFDTLRGGLTHDQAFEEARALLQNDSAWLPGNHRNIRVFPRCGDGDSRAQGTTRSISPRNLSRRVTVFVPRGIAADPLPPASHRGEGQDVAGEAGGHRACGRLGRGRSAPAGCRPIA